MDAGELNLSPFGRGVVAIIADTFAVDSHRIGRGTTADDVDGWDSLGYSVLLARLSKKLDIEIGERIASSARNVGELIDLLEDEVERRG